MERAPHAHDQYHEAKTDLHRLIEAAVRGESFIIAKAGKPTVTVTVTAVDPPGGDGYGELSVTSDHAVIAATLPLMHKDPFDPMLIAQAICEAVTLLTANAVVASYAGPIRKV